MAKVAVTDPPGLLMYRQMSRSGSSDSRCSNWAVSRLALPSVISVFSMTMRSFSKRE